MISPSTLRETEFEEKLQLFIYDLIVVSAAKFNKVKFIFHLKNKIEEKKTHFFVVAHFGIANKNTIYLSLYQRNLVAHSTSGGKSK